MDSLDRRLEYIRAAVGAHTVRAFWQRLYEGSAAPLSYEAVNNYQRGSREPPAKYLERICSVFEVSPAYLLLGEGPVFMSETEHWLADAENAANQEAWEENQLEWFFAAFPPLRRLPLQVRYHFLEVWSSWNNSGWYSTGARGALTDPRGLEIGKRVAEQLLHPFGQMEPRVITDEFADYATAMLHALSLALRVPPEPRAEVREDT